MAYLLNTSSSDIFGLFWVGLRFDIKQAFSLKVKVKVAQVSSIAGGFFTSWATREAQEYWSG